MLDRGMVSMVALWVLALHSNPWQAAQPETCLVVQHMIELLPSLALCESCALEGPVLVLELEWLALPKVLHNPSFGLQLLYWACLPFRAPSTEEMTMLAESA